MLRSVKLHVCWDLFVVIWGNSRLVLCNILFTSLFHAVEAFCLTVAEQSLSICLWNDSFPLGCAHLDVTLMGRNLQSFAVMLYFILIFSKFFLYTGDTWDSWATFKDIQQGGGFMFEKRIRRNIFRIFDLPATLDSQMQSYFSSPHAAFSNRFLLHR